MAIGPNTSAGPIAQAGRARTASLLPTLREIWSLGALLAFYFLAELFFGESSYRAVNYGGPLVFSAILSYGCWGMIRIEGKNLWTALFWFRLSTIVYFGLGEMLVYVVNDATRLYMESFFLFSDEDIFKFNLIITLSAIIVLLMARLVLVTTGKRSVQEASNRITKVNKNDDKGLFIAAIVILGLGVIIGYVFVFPYRMGWTGFVLPGIVTSLAKLLPVGVFLMSLWSLRNAKWLMPFIFALVSIDIAINLLMFTKSRILLILIMVSLAFLWDRLTIKKLLIVGFVIAGTFFLIKPVVDHGRTEMGVRYGGNVQASLGERLDILAEYFDKDYAPRTYDERQGGLSRFSYVNAATFIVHLYDTGQPGEWPELLPAVFIPRMFWPEKPIITGIGLDIYELGTGNRGSSAGAGIFADAYWAYGWWGVVLFMSVYGTILGFLTRFASRVMREGRWLYFPIVLMGLRYGMRTDGHYISDVAGALVILVAYYIMIRIVELVIKSIKMPTRRI